MGNAADEPDDSEWEPHTLHVLSLRNRAWRMVAFTAILIAIGWTSWESLVSPETESLPAPFVLELNQATEAELNLLPGIGPKSVDAIVAYRAARGGFASVEELTRIPGIKEGKLKTLRPYITVIPPQRVQP